MGQNQKLTESNYLLTPIQMGARVYLPTLGRFTAVDPTEGGTDNNYAYANDPVNEFDLSGNIVETAADVAGVAYDIHEMYKKPSWGNAGMLAWSVAAAIVPVVPGSWAGRAGSAAIKASKGVEVQPIKKAVAWSAGRPHNATKNAAQHYVKHAKGIGAKTQKAYNNSARNTYRQAIQIHKYKNGRTAYADTRGRITVLNNRGKIVTHFKPRHLDRYWTNNVKGR